MTIEELWELFPIFLVAHNDKWNDDYMEIESELRKLLSDCDSLRINHIGSTAISNIWAKNIVDVLVEIPASENIETAAETLKQSGFIIMSVNTKRISLNKGYTKEGFADKVFHVHLRYSGDNDELYFRDYLKFGVVIADTESEVLAATQNREDARSCANVALNNYAKQQTDFAAGEEPRRAPVEQHGGRTRGQHGLHKRPS